jgi:hypothetical protein
MCFGGGNKTSSNTSTTLASDPRSFFRWWTPPAIETPTLKLNEEALDKQELRKKRTGYERFQIPLASANATSGLGIPKKGGGRG